jgi:hypothetical protein
MVKIPLRHQWKIFQLERVQNIHEWYKEHYLHMQIHDPIIKYIILWSVFNALYNTSDLPNNHLPEKVNGRYRFLCKLGHKTPKINISRDFERIKKIAEKLVGLGAFTKLFTHQDVKRHISTFVNRIPSVAQDEGIDEYRAIPIILQDEKEKWTVESEFILASIRGVASLDYRLFLADGYKFFEYSSIDNPWDAHGKQKDILLTTQQLLSVLYQLRNNTVHGGSTAHHKKDIIFDGQPILEAIVEFIFEYREEIYTGEK